MAVKKVELKIPKFPGVMEDDVLIGINGVNTIIPRGITVKVPEYVAAEYYRSEQAKETFYSNQAAKIAAATVPTENAE